MLSLNILETNEQIARMILDALAKEINVKLLRAERRLKKEIGLIVERYLRLDDTTYELTQGDLKAHFGLYPGQPQAFIDALATALREDIHIEHIPVKASGGHFNGGLNISLVSETFIQEIQQLPEAVVFTKNGEPLPWLEWLLIRGDEIIISEHSIIFKDGGRSGQAIMIQSPGGFWRVPPEFSGTIEDNWLTRLISNNIKQFAVEVGKIIEQELNR